MLTGKNLKSQKNFDQSGVLYPLMLQLRKATPLSKEEENKLFVKYRNGDKKAGEKIILSNQGFIYSVAKTYARNEDEVMDYFIEGIDGIMAAMDKFTPEYDTKFYTYAQYYIRRSMYAYYVSQRDSVKQAGKAKLGNRPSAIKNQFFVENGYYPDTETLIKLVEEDYLKKHPDVLSVNITGDMLYDNEFVSCNAPIDNDDYTFEESDEYNTKTSVKNEYEQQEDNEYAKAVVMPLLRFLDNDERLLMMKLYGIGEYANYTRQQVCDENFLTEDALKRIENNLLSRMRETAYKNKMAV